MVKRRMTDYPTPLGGGSKPPPTAASVLGGLPGTLLAIATAVAGIVTTIHNSQLGEDRDRAGYETLKLAVERNTEGLADNARSDAELRVWVQELSERLERRQAITEKVIARKVTRPSAPPPPPPVDPVPPPPPPPAPPAPATLPPFDALATE